MITETIQLDLLKSSCIQFMFAYAEHDIDRMLALCDPAAEVHFVQLGDNGSGLARELGRAIWSSLIECFPDIDNTVHAATQDGDRIRCQVLIEGTQAKDFAGITSHGLRFSSEHIFVFSLDDDYRITDIEVHWDHDDFVRQLTVGR